jgi:hypothetical protein
MQNEPGRLLHFACCILHFAAATALVANDLTVDRRSVRLDESITIIVSLEDAFATVDNVNVPMRNLLIEGAPSVSSEFSWINGSVVRRKVFRFTARPLQPGAALVGPLVLVGEGGQRETLPPVSLQVVPDAAAGTNDALTILRELVATNRELFFVAAEVDNTSAVVGEQVVVTWYLYNAARVQRWQITRVPKLPDFWSEEIDVRKESGSQVLVGNQPMEKIALRRVAIFPLHSGALAIGSMEVGAEVLRRGDDSPFGIFEGSLVDVRFPSASVTIDVHPLPADASAADIIGDATLECTTPIQRAGGPVTLRATLRGRANLRTAAPPRFVKALAGESEVQQVSLNVERARDGVSMTRRWSYVIFPAASGTMTIPPLTSTVFNPRTKRREELRCAAATLEVQQASETSANIEHAPAPLSVRRNWRAMLPWIGMIAVALIAILTIIPRVRRAIARRRVVRALTADLAPSRVREAVHELLAKRGIEPAAIAREASDRGDAYRALRSLLDAVEHDRALELDAADDIERRVRDLVQSLR